MKKILTLVCCISLLSVVYGCGDSDNPSPTGGGGTPLPVSISGTVSKAPINAASVTIHAITAAGGMGAQVGGPFTTNATGAYTGELPGGTTGPLLVVAAGGSYLDEATASTVTADPTTPMYGILRIDGTNHGNATPITHAIVVNAQKRIMDGAPLGTAVDNAIVAMQTEFGFDPTSVQPVIPTTFAARQTGDVYGAFLAGISQLLDGAPELGVTWDAVETWVLVIAWAQDLSDGVLDGTDIFGDPILIDPDGPGPMGDLQLPAMDVTGVADWVDAVLAWLSDNGITLTIPDIDLTDFGDPDGNLNCTATVSGSITGTGDPIFVAQNPISPNLAQAICSGSSIFSFVFTEEPFTVITVIMEFFTTNVTSVGIFIAGAGTWASVGDISGVTFTFDGTNYSLNFSNAVLQNSQTAAPVTLNGTWTGTVSTGP